MSDNGGGDEGRWRDAPPPQAGRPEPTRAERRADAKAEKARAKAMRPWYRKKRFAIPLGLVVLIVVISALGGGGDTTATDDTAASDDTAAVDEPAQDEGDTTADGGQGEEQPQRATIGEPADDGAFQFTVDEVNCGRTTIGDPEFLGEEAQGKFCLLTARVENTGTEAGSLFADNQYLIDDQGRRHSADSAATIALPRNTDAWLSEINPGNAVEGVFVFDVPEGATIVEAELHDSAFSGGVLVDVGG